MDLNFNKNEDHNKLLVSNLKSKLTRVKLGGGAKRIEKHHSKGKMTARERIDYLTDDNTEFFSSQFSVINKIKTQYCQGQLIQKIYKMDFSTID